MGHTYCHDGFGVHTLTGGARHFTVQDIEVFRVFPKIDRSPAFVCHLQSVLAETHFLDETVRDFVQQLLDMRADVERDEQLLLKELLFVEKFVTAEHSSDMAEELQSSTKKSNEEVIQLNETSPLITEIEAAIERIHVIADDKKKKAAESEDQVISMNVGGTIVCVLRSTLIGSAPESFLASRVSGRWTEQESDLDEDGNIFQVG